MLGDIAEALLDIAFNLFGFRIDISNLGKTTKDLCDWTKILESDLGTVMKTLNGAFISIGLSLLTVFIMIELLKKLMDIDRVSWQHIFMVLIRFLIFKVLIENSFEFINMIMKIGQQAVTLALNSLNYNETITTNVASNIGDMINNAEGINLILFDMMPLVMFLVFLIIYLPMIGTYVMIIAQIFTRVIKIVVVSAYAPIPLAIGCWEDGSSTGKRFIMSIVALAFEAIIMILCVHIYAKGIAGLVSNVTENSFGQSFGSMIGVLLLNGILTVALQQTSQYAEKWTGA